jgi:hypothetical protein
VHAGGDLHVRAGWLENARGVIVQEHLAALRKSRQCKHAPHVASRDHSGRGDDAVGVDDADEADLAPAGESNRSAHGTSGG